MYRKVLNVVDNPRKLRSVSTPFNEYQEWTEEDRGLIKDLLDTFTVMQGLGLAAPQIGIFKRAIVVNPKHLGLSEESEELLMINPEISLSGPTERSKEACFSVPYVDGFVERPQLCEVSYTSENGDKKSLSAEGYAAVCLQHEIDHLDGILYIDRMGSLSRKMLLRKIEKANKRRLAAAKEAKAVFDRDHNDIMGSDNTKKKTTYSKKRKPKPRKRRSKKSKKR